jgi:putative membrane protein
VSDDARLVQPRIETETTAAPRLDLPVTPLPDRLTKPSGTGTPVLVLSGFAVLALGLAGLEIGNFVAAEFARATWLGWLTLVIAVLGFGLILAGIIRELRGLAALRAVDAMRRDLASDDPHRRIHAARHWLAGIEGGDALRPALDALNDPDAVLSLLRSSAEARLRTQSDALSRKAAMQVVAGMAATPAPALVVLLVSWRAVRLIRQIATLYGVRPGLLATLGLLRRTALSATATAVTEAAINTAAHAVLSSPLPTHIAGEMAGGAVAARRMVVLGRATSVACSPLPPE